MILLSVFVPHWWLIGLSILTLSSSSKDNGTDKSFGSSTTILEKYLTPFDLELHDFPETGRGIRTLVDRSPGDILLKVPIGDTITAVENASQKNFHSLLPEQQLAMTLLHLRDQENHPYVSSILPKEHYAIWNLPESIWNDLELPRCYRETFLATRQMVEEFTLEQGNGNNQNDDRIWAFSMVRSRSMAAPELETSSSTTTTTEGDISSAPIAVIPGLDLFNHQFDAGTLLQLLDKGGAEEEEAHWTLTSSKSYASGDQIFLSYGDDKDNWKLLLTYGFCASDNPNHSLLFWTWQDLLGAAGQVRPSVFPPRVQQSLLQHPQLYETYTVLSEQRATFSYDGKTQQPRESLMNGLQMMENLAVQLGQPNDESLANDILDQLLETRRSELQSSIRSVKKKKQLAESSSNNDEWQPFLSSLLLVLEDELKCIS